MSQRKGWCCRTPARHSLVLPLFISNMRRSWSSAACLVSRSSAWLFGEACRRGAAKTCVCVVEKGRFCKKCRLCGWGFRGGGGHNAARWDRCGAPSGKPQVSGSFNERSVFARVESSRFAPLGSSSQRFPNHTNVTFFIFAPSQPHKRGFLQRLAAQACLCSGLGCRSPSEGCQACLRGRLGCRSASGGAARRACGACRGSNSLMRAARHACAVGWGASAQTRAARHACGWGRLG